MINHISRQSHEFRDFERHGTAIAVRRPVHHARQGLAGRRPADRRRRPDLPAQAGCARSRRSRSGTRGARSASGPRSGRPTGPSRSTWTSRRRRHATLITGWLAFFAEHGVRIVRLDAVGYVDQEAGHDLLHGRARDLRVPRLARRTSPTRSAWSCCPRSTTRYATHERLAAHGFWTYDFVLPGLVLHAFETGDARRLAAHLARSPERQFTTLDCHDGIPVRPDLDGILDAGRDARPRRSRAARGVAMSTGSCPTRTPDGVDVHQLNCTYYSALGCDDDRYLAARAIQLFARGVPQIYYVGLLAGRTTMTPSTPRARVARSTATTTRRTRSRRRWPVRWSGGSSTWSGCGTPTRHSTATSPWRPRTVRSRWPGKPARRSSRSRSTSQAAARPSPATDVQMRSRNGDREPPSALIGPRVAQQTFTGGAAKVYYPPRPRAPEEAALATEPADVLIVGAGASGGVVARRLAEAGLPGRRAWSRAAGTTRRSTAARSSTGS